jgi:Protein O-mannosyl-transferase TMEM260-like
MNYPGTRAGVHLLLVFAATLVVYVVTMPRTIGLEDAGLFQMVCHLDGIGHPPGYPLFTNLCQPFVKLSIFPSGVFAGNFLSALFAALACCVFFSCCLSITKDLLLSTVAALAYGFSATFWSQAIIIEVYSLTVLTFLLCWRVLLAFVESGNVRWLYLSIVIYGGGLSNHWPLMILSTPALLATLFPRLELILAYLRSPGFWALSILALLLGLSPYLTILTASDTGIAVYGDVDSLEELFRYVARSAYSDHQLTAGAADRLQYMSWLLVESAGQFGYLVVPLLLIGIVASLKSLSHSTIVSLLFMYLGSTFLLNFLLNFRYEVFWQAIFKPYPVIGYLALSFWLAVGTRILVDWLRRLNARSARAAPWVVATLVILSVASSNLLENNKRKDGWVEDYGLSLLEALPRDAVFFASGDVEIGVLGFLHLVMGVRPDIELRSWDNLVFSNRLVSPFASDEIQQAKRAEFLQGSARPVLASSVPLAPAAHQGAYYRYTPGVPRSVERNPQMDLILDQLLDLYLNGLITDPHEIHFAYYRLVSFTRQYVRLALTHKDLTGEEFQRLERLQSTFPGKLATLETLLHLRSASDGRDSLLEIAKAAEKQIPPFATSESLAVFYEFYGRIMAMQPADNPGAISHFERSIDTYPVPGNTSICPLADLYRMETSLQKLEILKQRFPKSDCG